MPVPSAADLDALVLRARERDEGAFASLIDATQLELRCFVAAHAGATDLIEEVVQATFVICFERFADYQPRGTFLAWLKGIARNRLRQEARERRRFLPADDAALEAAVERSEAESAAEDARDDLVAALGRCVDGLAPTARELLDGFYRERLSLADLARRSRRTHAAVAMALSRIRAALRTCVQGGEAEP
jgi:RNA polymerase sigma-70 factor (ECF subfamily)